MKAHAEMQFSQMHFRKKRGAAIHLSRYIRVMAGNHSKWAHRDKHHQTTGKYHITDKNKSCLSVYSLILFGDSLINNVCVSLADSCPQDTSHYAEISFWYSINHNRRKSKDVHAVGEGGTRASKHHEQYKKSICRIGRIISNRPPQAQMTELWIMRNSWPSRRSQRQVPFPFSRDQRCTPPLEVRRFNLICKLSVLPGL